jgi:lambda family phage portal protein
MRQCLRSIAAGLGVSYETVSRDFSQTNYSSSRLSLLEDRDNYRQIQGWLIENLHQVVFDAWLDMAALSGALNLPGYDNDPGRYNAAKWMPRSWEWVDPLKEVQAYKEAVRCGFMTQGEVVAKSGGDLDELLTTRANELERAQELGLVFDTNAAQVAFTGVEQPQAPEPALDPVKPGDTQPADPAADPPADPAAAEAP